MNSSVVFSNLSFLTSKCLIIVLCDPACWQVCVKLLRNKLIIHYKEFFIVPFRNEC